MSSYPYSTLQHHIVFGLIAILSIFHSTSALEVSASSPCSNFCIDSSSGNASDPLSSATFTKDLSCLDSDYKGDNSTAVGRKFRMCITCEQTSDATAAGVEGQGDENDVYWFLFNLKSTVAWCVSGFFQAQQNPSTTLANSLCAASCDPISAAINDRLLQTNESLQYNYCESDNGAFLNGVDTCASCLDKNDNVQILGNFLSALKTACTLRPAPGTTLSLPTTVFELPTPSPISSALSSQRTDTSTSSASMSTGAIAGTAIAVLIVVAIFGALLSLHLHFKRKTINGVRARGYELDGRGGGISLGDGADVKYHQQEMASRPREMDGDRPPVELPGSLDRGRVSRIYIRGKNDH